MYVRIRRSGSGKEKHEYLQLVRSYRDEGRVRQEVMLTLGRKDELVASGMLDNIIQGLARHSERLRVVEIAKSMAARSSKAWGPALAFGRLWEEQGLPEMLGALARERRFRFDVERAAFALALQRLSGCATSGMIAPCRCCASTARRSSVPAPDRLRRDRPAIRPYRSTVPGDIRPTDPTSRAP